MRTTAVFWTLALAAVAPADWMQFRGDGGQGLAGGAKLPRKFSATENLAWKAELPGRGLSSPIVVKGKVFVTASNGPRDDRLRLFCFDAATGKQVWERQFRATGRVMLVLR